MTDIKGFLEDKLTYEAVVETLVKKGCKVDDTRDFIAGGSVSNILYSMIHGGEPVINDIDIYKQVKEEFNDNKKNSAGWYPATYVTEEGLEIVDDSYGRVFVADNGSKMRVSRHLRKGIMNIIEYLYDDYGSRMHGNKVKKSREMVVLEGFDLNCCKSGISITEGKIIYTQEFLDFLKTKQLKVVSPCAPIQSTIRIYKKMKDLNCFCNIEHEMRFLTVASRHIQSGQMTKYIGPETYGKYLKVKDFVDKYFKLREPQNSDEIPYSLRDKYYIGNKRNPEVNIWLFEPIMNFDITENVGSINNFKRVWELLYSYKKHSEQDKIHKIFYKNVFLGKMNEDHWSTKEYTNERNSNGEPIYIEKPYYNSSRYTHQMILSKKNYYKCDFDVKHVDYIDNFTKEHHHMKMFLKDCDTLIEQYNLIKFIKSIAKKEGDWVIGMLENTNHELALIRDENNNLLANNINKDTIIYLIDKFKKENIDGLVDKIDLSNFEFKNCVEELNTTLKLKEEGSKMGHCVGGYSDTVRQGKSRIFHVDCDGIGSTVEISTPETTSWVNGKTTKIVDIFQASNDDVKCMVFYEDKSYVPMPLTNYIYRIRQHHGRYPEKGNLTPTETNQRIVKELVDYLNLNCLPSNYQIRVKIDKKENALISTNEDWF